ncbi:hypothetical protein RSSM_05958 [Rhodopirellula sallentina SM41]|uniref:Uncharacterized protein n=1 Tax=Rhodopirellula sallentina SM41 TaxID=1263870 RepID=M5U9E4_9BACT|nr:hypothetical protein RSSM_05958 [Rhodopirellula sallentina SM41]
MLHNRLDRTWAFATVGSMPEEFCKPKSVSHKLPLANGGGRGGKQ